MKRIAGMILAAMILASGCSSSGAGSAAEETVEETKSEREGEAEAGTEALDYSGINNYIGTWEDQYSLRCTMEISSINESQVSIAVNWSGGAAEDWEWKMTGTFQPENESLEYSDCVYTKYIYADNGNVTSEEVYTDGTGKIYMKEDGYLYWEDSMENQGGQCYFAKTGSPEINSGAEFNPYLDSVLLWKSYFQPLMGEDCAGLSKEELRIARNELYAAYGRIFTDQNLAAYFNSKSWYHGTVPADQFSESVLTDIQLDNVELIKLYEDLAGQEETGTSSENGNMADDDWNDGSGLEGVMHKSVDPWGYPWAEYKYTDYETLYRTNGRDESNDFYKTVMSGYVKQMLDDMIVITVNYDSDDDYMQTLLNTEDTPDQQMVIVYLQDNCTISYGSMYMEGDVITVYGSTLGNVEASTTLGTQMTPAVLAYDILLEDGTFPVTQLNEMHAYSEWEKTLQ